MFSHVYRMKFFVFVTVISVHMITGHSHQKLAQPRAIWPYNSGRGVLAHFNKSILEEI